MKKNYISPNIKIIYIDPEEMCQGINPSSQPLGPDEPVGTPSPANSLDAIFDDEEYI